MKRILNKLLEYQKLTQDEAHEVLVKIASGEYNESQIAAFITIFLMRSVSLDELQGFRRALLELCIPMDFGSIESVDVCGTGGDGKNTFNISTTSAFVIAGAGYKVAKHGNYGVSSFCGSSNVLDYLGYQFNNDQSKLSKQLDQAGICFMHAPLFHPALKTVGQIRRQLGIKTFFNMLGPLVNPSKPSHQLVGVFDLKLARMYQYILQNTDTKYCIVYALDGYDEVSLTNEVKIIDQQSETLARAEYFGLPSHNEGAIHGGKNIENAAEILISVLKDESTVAQKNVVLANAALAIRTFNPNSSIDECISIAQESIESGKAYSTLNKMIELS